MHDLEAGDPDDSENDRPDGVELHAELLGVLVDPAVDLAAADHADPGTWQPSFTGVTRTGLEFGFEVVPRAS